MNKKLLNKIEKFLSEKREPKPGNEWSEITDEDVNQLYQITRMLIEAKCKQWNKGTYPIGYAFVNRQTHFWPCPIWEVSHDMTIEDVRSMALMINSLSERIRNYTENKIDEERRNASKTNALW